MLLDRTLQELFAGEDVRYRVPIYQRHYVWNKTHWEHLWNDIEEKADSMTDSRIDQPKPHFTGVIVIGKNEEGEIVIVDGQQRLTTFQIILCAILDICKVKFKGSKDTEDIQKTVSEFLKNPSPLNNEGNPDRLYKLLPTTGPDRDAFCALVAGNSPGEGLIPEAYGHFKKKIEQYLGNDYEKLISLYQTVFFYFKFVEMPLDRTYPAAKVFESLNGRGIPLSQFDLLRNNLFLRAGNQAGSHYTDYWTHFNNDSDWFSDEIVDDFLQNFLEVKLNRKYNSKSSLFDLYQRIYLGNLRRELGISIGHEDDPKLVEREFKELQLYSSSYAEIANSSHESPVWFYEFIKTQLQVTNWHPLILFLKAESKLSEENQEKIFRILECYLIHYLLCYPEIQKWDRQKHFQELRRAIVGKIPKVKSESGVVESILEVLKDDQNKWSSDKQILPALHAAGHHWSRSLIQYILFIIELKNIDPEYTDSQLLNLTELNIEHIMPGKWENARDPKTNETLWPITETGERYHEKVRERNNSMESIGNLTIINEKLNNENLNNKSFNQKKKLYDKHSRLSLTKDIIEHEEWDVEKIRIREEKLVRLFCEIWPSANVLEEELKQ